MPVRVCVLGTSKRIKRTSTVQGSKGSVATVQGRFVSGGGCRSSVGGQFRSDREGDRIQSKQRIKPLKMNGMPDNGSSNHCASDTPPAQYSPGGLV